MILGICGNKGSGKSTLANLLLEMVHRAQAIAFADPLKDFVAEVYDWPREKLEDQEFKETPDQRYVRLSKGQIAALGWDNLIDDWHEGRRPEAKLRDVLGLTNEEYSDWVQTGEVHLTPRHAMKRLGTEWGRGCCEDTWTRYAIRRAQELEAAGCPLVIITDVRFPNEGRAITEAGGRVVRIIRGAGSTDPHPSEQEVRNVECYWKIDNNLDLATLRDSASGLLNAMQIQHERQQVSTEVLPEISQILRDSSTQRVTLTVAELHRESYQTACDKGWHDEDDLNPNFAVVGLADEMLTVMGVARRMEDIRKGIEPSALENELPEVRLTDLTDKQVRVLAWLALICSEAAEAAEDVIANRWETTLNEKGKPEGFRTEVADIEIRIGDMLGALGFDLEDDLRTKLAFNRTRPRRHGNLRA